MTTILIAFKKRRKLCINFYSKISKVIVVFMLLKVKFSRWSLVSIPAMKISFTELTIIEILNFGETQESGSELFFVSSNTMSRKSQTFPGSRDCWWASTQCQPLFVQQSQILTFLWELEVWSLKIIKIAWRSFCYAVGKNICIFHFLLISNVYYFKPFWNPQTKLLLIPNIIYTAIDLTYIMLKRTWRCKIYQ